MGVSADNGRNRGEWSRLYEAQAELRLKIGGATDPETRAALQHQLVENRLALARLEADDDATSDSEAGLDAELAGDLDPNTQDDSRELGLSSAAAEPVAGTTEPNRPLTASTGPGTGNPHNDIDDLIDALTAPVSASGSTSLRHSRSGSWNRSAIAIGLAGVLLSVGLSWLAFDRSSDGGTVDAGATTPPTTTPADGADADRAVQSIRSVLAALGFDRVEVEQVDGVVRLSGQVASEEDREAVISAAEALLDGAELDASGLTLGPEVGGTELTAEQEARAGTFQAELNRVVASTPLIFEVGTSDLTALQQRILNSVATVMVGYPDLAVTIVGYTDQQGEPEANRQLSLLRASNVKAYLVGQGVADNRLTVEARGEDVSTGSTELASLERRVEFQVTAATAPAAGADAEPLRIAVVAPSARNDLAFTQSMVDAVNVIAAERGNVEVTIADNLFVPAEAATAIGTFADEGYDLIIAHGVEFGSELVAIVTEHPDTTFAWGTATDTFGLPNLYAYDAAAEQGGYVLGSMSRMLTGSQVIGVVGPIEVGDAQRYVNGFRAGAESQDPKPTVAVTYTGSFGDIAMAAEAAQLHVAAGADILTGTGEMVVGAVSVAQDNGALWFGTQASQAPLAPGIVVASQIYHWEVVLRPMMADVDAGVPQGRAIVADLANGGLVIDHNPGYALPPEVRQRADEVVGQIVAGTIVVPR